VSPGSDIDLLAIVDGYDPRFDADIYSIYSYKRIQEIWKEGNPFAWHLSLEAKILYTSDKSDIISSLGSPEIYQNCVRDCGKFFSLFREARISLENNSISKVFDLSTVFLSIRNIATCFSLGVLKQPDFSRHSALHLGDHSLKIPPQPYEVLERSRILCTRGHGSKITPDEAEIAFAQFPQTEQWMARLVMEAKRHAT
jgi:hypothetical protein